MSGFINWNPFIGILTIPSRSSRSVVVRKKEILKVLVTGLYTPEASLTLKFLIT